MQTIYSFPITNHKKHFYTLFANLLLLVNFIFFGIFKYQQYQQKLCSSVFSCMVLPNIILAVFLIRFYFVLTKRKLSFTNFHFALLATAGWLGLQQWLPAAVILILGIAEYLVNRDLICTTSKDGISISSFPQKKYAWSDLNNVLLVNGIFTIDQKNNRILQLDVSEEVIPFPEDSYHQFVQEQLGAVSP